MDEPKDIVQRIDGETGEIISEFEIERNSSLFSNENITKRNDFLKKAKDVERFRNRTNELDGFCFLYYERSEPLYKSEQMSKSNVTRLLYLATFIDYKTNELVNYRTNGRKYSMDRRDIKCLMNLSDKAFKEFFEEMLNREIIYKCNESFFISKKYFTKGKLEQRGSVTRMFVGTIRNLYEASNPRQHKHLANAFTLIPFLDYESNALVGTDGHKLTITEIAEILEYDVSHTDRLKKDLRKIFITRDEEKFYLFCHIIKGIGDVNENFFMINPLAFYAGSSDRVYKALVLLTKNKN